MVLGIPRHMIILVTKFKNWMGHFLPEDMIKNISPLGFTSSEFRAFISQKQNAQTSEDSFEKSNQNGKMLCNFSVFPHFIMARSPFPPTESQIFKIAS